MIFENKSKYEGEFQNDKFWGNGVFEWNDGRKYIGKWKNNCMEGIGEFIFDDTTRYKGEYKKNKRDGKGLFYHDNLCYLGEWVNGMPHGEGKIFQNEKNIITGIFRFGKFVGQEENKKDKKSKSSKKSLNKLEDTGFKSNSKSLETDSQKKDGKANEKKENKC